MEQTKQQLKQLIRTANLIASSYHDQPPAQPLITLSEVLTQRLDRISNLLGHAENKGWRIATAQLTRDFQSQWVRLQGDIERTISQLGAKPPLVLIAADILRDLLAIEAEFGTMSCCNRSRLLSVVTEPIELEGTYLGAFMIRLDFGTLEREANGDYEIIPIDPYPAASDEDVTHPHVQGMRLCEGDAQPAIRLALRQGRLLDFFQLVNNVLHNYNASSAYVSLNDWGDMTCSDCGHLTNSDDCDNCSVCEERVCDSCWCNCADCDERHCGGCNETCAGCLDDVCKSCARVCNECHETFCSDCLQENERCIHCDKKSNDDSTEIETDDEDSTDARDADSAIHADCLGQAAVPA